MTGMLLVPENHREVYVYGTAFDTHELLYFFAEKKYGRIKKVLWAGEAEAKDGTITAFNEKAGFFSPKRNYLSKESLGLEQKTNQVGSVMQFFESHPGLRSKITAETRLFSHAEHPQSLTPDLQSLSEFRHDLNAPIGQFKAFSTLLGRNTLKFDEFLNSKKMGFGLRTAAEKLLEIATVLETHHYQSSSVSSDDIAQLKAVCERIRIEGWSPNPEVRKTDLEIFVKIRESVLHGTGQIGSITLPDTSPALP